MKTKLISSREYTKHITGYGHPESPARTLAIEQALLEAGYLLEPPLECSQEDLLRCHTREYLAIIQHEVGLGEGRQSWDLSTGDAKISPDSYMIARLAAGGAIEGVRAVLREGFDSAFSAIRPPGHHACSDKGMGFCLFNNAAIAARYAQDVFGIKKVAIVDWDVHHGNGTEEIFKSDPTVFYFSTHQLDNYPGTGAFDYRGEGGGIGTTLNVPIMGGMGSRAKVLEGFEGFQSVMESYKPDLIIISAGFDGHIDDPLGGFDLLTEDFATLTRMVKQMARKTSTGKIVSLLEGGYNLRALAESVVTHVKTLNE